MEPSGDPSEPSDGGSIVLFLGLYLLLVAFFIMLNAISHFDDGRVKEAVASVSETFQSPRPSSASQVRIALDGKTRIVPTTLFGNLQAEFRKALPVVEIEEDSEGGVLTVTLAARAVRARPGAPRSGTGRIGRHRGRRAEGRPGTSPPCPGAYRRRWCRGPPAGRAAAARRQPRRRPRARVGRARSSAGVDPGRRARRICRQDRDALRHRARGRATLTFEKILF